MSNTRKRLTRRAAAGATATAMLLPALALTAAPASALPGFALSRLAGGPAAPDRYGTASEIALDTFGTLDSGGGAPVVVLARGDRFPDALAGSYLAGGLTAPAPILLTQVDSVPQVTLDTLAALGAEEVVILGGTAAVSAAVQTQLDATYTVRRLAGPDRYATAAAVAGDLPATQIALTDSADADTVADERTAFLASGAEAGGGADALAAGPVAYSEGLPVLLTAPDALPDATRQALLDLGIERVIVLGGSAAVSEDVVASLPAGITAERVAGPTRGATAVEIANLAIDEFFFTDQAVGLANGSAFADSLTAASRAGLDGFPILLTLNATELGEFTEGYLNANAGTLIDGFVFGGSAVVSEALVTAAEEAGQVDNVVPTVTLEVPSEALSVNEAAFTITGSTEAGATVSVRSGDTEVVSVTADVAGDFSAAVTLADGANDYTIVATDAAGNVSTVTTVPTITLDTAAPAAATVTTPSGPETTAEESFLIEGTAEADAVVAVLDATDTEVAATSTDEVSGEFTVLAPLVEGANDFTIVVTDAAGNASAPTVVPTITRGAVAPDTTPPVSTGTAPADGDTDVALNVAPTATFDEDLDATTSTVTLTAGGVDVPGTEDVVGNTISFTPAADLDATTEYVATFTASDVTGNAAAPITVTFTTGAAPDTTAPALASTDPADAATDAAVTATPSATFNEALGAGSSATLTAGGVAVPGSPSLAGETITFTPDADLDAGTEYVATFQVEDVAGNAAADVVVTFTTAAPAADVTPPTFTTATAAAGGQTLTVNYSEVVDCATVQVADFAFSLTAGPDSPSPITPDSVDCTGAADDSLVFTFPGTPFDPAHEGLVEVDDAAVVSDPAGNDQDVLDSVTFTAV